MASNTVVEHAHDGDVWLPGHGYLQSVAVYAVGGAEVGVGG